MPSKSEAQHKLMEAAAHTTGGYGGVPQSVGKEFVAADNIKPFAAGIIFTTGDRILLAKRVDNGQWAFPGGHIENKESPEEAASRECEEEVGYLAACNLLKKIGEFNGFVAFSHQTIDFDPILNNENTKAEWFDKNNLPEPLLPECQEILTEFFKPQTELDVARLIASGDLPSPQRVGAMWMFNLRITGTGTAYRQKLDQYVYREPENYLNDEFLARCNGLAIIWDHPESNKLDSEEYASRSIGAIMLPYIKDQEIWGIGKIYDEGAASAMINGNLSTSPSVIFSRILENSNIIMDENKEILIEGIPSIIDHLAICEAGVWDKGGDPSGVIVNNQEAKTEMDKKDEEMKADNCAADSELSETETENDLSIDEKIERSVKAAIAEVLEAIKMHKSELGEEEKADEIDPMNMSDEPMPSVADSEKDEKEKDKAYADSVELAKLRKQVAELERSMPKQRSNDEYDALAAAQFKAEKHYSAFGDSLSKCRPMDGESVLAYRKRMAKGLQKHSEKWGKVNIAVADASLLDIIEEGIYADSMLAAMQPVTSDGGMPRAVVTNEGGRTRTEYVGGTPLAVFAPFRMTPRQLAAVREHPKH